MIRHVVSWKFIADDASEKDAAFAELAASFGPLPHHIPAIKTLHFGRDLGETSTNWDAVLIMDFDSTAELAEYQGHPLHQPVRDIVRRVTSERSAIDFEL